MIYRNENQTAQHKFCLLYLLIIKGVKINGIKNQIKVGPNPKPTLTLRK